MAGAATLEGLAVTVENKSEPVLCAEKDNINIPLTAIPGTPVRSFRIEAQHPVYIGSILKDRNDADWTACDMKGDPSFPSAPRKVTLFESIDLWVVGYTFPSFWRPNDVPFKVGDRVERGLHLVQIWVLNKGRAEEVLVVYPPDGYWRARPLPPEHLRWTAYGSSFMVGPVEFDGRPVVNLREIAFDPKTRNFTLAFTDGNSAAMKLAVIDDEHQVLEVAFAKPVEGKAFAALRSMYVTAFNNDAAQIALRGPGSASWTESPIMGFARQSATDVWAGRHLPSRHNTSAPDMIFNGFSAGPTPAGRPTVEAAKADPLKAK